MGWVIPELSGNDQVLSGINCIQINATRGRTSIQKGGTGLRVLGFHHVGLQVGFNVAWQNLRCWEVEI